MYLFYLLLFSRIYFGVRGWDGNGGNFFWNKILEVVESSVIKMSFLEEYCLRCFIFDCIFIFVLVFIFESEIMCNSYSRVKIC